MGIAEMNIDFKWRLLFTLHITVVYAIIAAVLLVN